MGEGVLVRLMQQWYGMSARTKQPNRQWSQNVLPSH